MTVVSQSTHNSAPVLLCLCACVGILFFLTEQSLKLQNKVQDTVKTEVTIAEASRRAHYDGLRQTIMQSKATIPTIVEALEQPYQLGVANTLYALHKMHFFRPVHHLMDALWQNNQSKYPNVNWAAINSDNGRIALATTLMRVKVKNTEEYIQYIRTHQDSEDPQVLSQVGMALGFNADINDLPYLERLAESDTPKIAEGAITGLSTFQGNKAKRVMIGLAKKYDGTARGKFLKQMLRDFYSWPPMQPYEAQSPLPN